MKNLFLTLVLLHFTFLSFSQEVIFGILPINQTINKGAINEVKVISDINPKFRADWVKQYIAVNLSVSCNGEMISVAGHNNVFNEEQLRILRAGETGSNILVEVRYYPNNNLSEEMKQMDFSYTIAPDLDATFPDGKKSQQEYLSSKAIDPLSKLSEADIHQVKVGFTINENGAVTNTKILQRSHLEQVDDQLLGAIKNMPNWIPAKNADGKNVSQQFEFIMTRDLCYYGNLLADK